MMNTYKIVENLETFETFFECPQTYWAEALALWEKDELPCPMSIGHQIFAPNYQGYCLLSTITEQELDGLLYHTANKVC